MANQKDKDPNLVLKLNDLCIMDHIEGITKCSRSTSIIGITFAQII